MLGRLPKELLISRDGNNPRQHSDGAHCHAKCVAMEQSKGAKFSGDGR